jgi:Ca2+-binding RTX toxin-like protein
MIGNGEDNFLAGLDGNDTLEGGTGDDVLFGHDGNDSLVGGAGDDALIAGTGADTMVGGDGNDVYEIFGAQKIVETKGQGTDTVFIIEGVTSYTMPTEIEYLDYSESTTNVIATGNALANGITGNGQANRIDGGSGDDTLVGRGGDDSLTGGTGADSMDGADGNDLYVIDNVGDAVFESGADTEDEIRSSVALTAFVAEIEHYSFTGKTAVDFTASDVANRVTGTARNDTLRGGTGNDTLDGGAGADVLISDEGDDTYVIDNTGDRIIDLGDGIDWVHSKLAVDLTLAKFDGIENATLLGTAGLALTGDEFANELNGNTGANKIGGGAGDDSLEGDAGNDTLDGGAGADALAGGAGNDLYIIDDFGDSVDETDGSGIDTVHAFTSFTLPGDVEILRLFGGDLTGNGNDIDNLITGTDGLNYLFGAGGNDTLDGGAGIDFLGGGDGQDSILGGAGDDVLIGHGGADMLVGGSGQDTYRYLGTDALALEPADVVLGFSIGGAEQDFVDVDAVLDELGIADGDRAGRISLVDTGTNVELRIDTTGDGTFDWHAVTLKGVSSTAELSVGTGATDDIQVGTL